MNALRSVPPMRGEIRQKEMMSLHTSWRVGGPADIWFKPADLDDLSGFISSLDDSVAVTWIGLGSNLLVRDAGIRGAVIATHGVMADLEKLDRHIVDAGGGVPCARIAKQCARWGLAGAEFFAGIPGTLGGALAMNAGAFGSETWDHVLDVDVMNRRGEVINRMADEYDIAYRSVVLHGGEPGPEWFVSVRLRFDEDPDIDPKAIRELLAKRKELQPIGLPSCGSVFRNPPDDHAARLIDACGLKGFAIGGAVVSEKHANFIINTGAATATDIEALINHVHDTVADQHGVDLIPEVRIMGDRT
jgi:UDP-N-acetylmuramate dehydrogenase